MHKISIDYSNCSIYKIEHIENESLIYVGHTTNFKQRKSNHKSNYNNNEKKRLCNIKLYQMIRDNGGWEMFKMIEIEKYKCNDRREADKRENEVMKELKSSMNMNKSFCTEDDVLERKKRYYYENKDKAKQYYEHYYEENKDKIKQYYEYNKYKILKNKKEYYLRKKAEKEKEKLFIQ